MIKERIGNILDEQKGIICHQVNHQGVMGAGLAKQIRTKYPLLFDDYFSLCRNYTFSYVREMGVISYYKVGEGLGIASVFGQEHYGRENNRVYTDYISLKNGLVNVARIAMIDGKEVFIPHGMGCGLAGGNWDIVRGIIETVFENTLDCYIIKLKQ